MAPSLELKELLNGLASNKQALNFQCSPLLTYKSAFLGRWVDSMGEVCPKARR